MSGESKNTWGWVQTASWEELGDLLATIARRINDHRKENSGNTPREIWKPCIELGPSYACVELVLWSQRGGNVVPGVMLKKRDALDQGWEGLKHINGKAVLPHDDLFGVQERLLDEITGDVELRDHLRRSFMDQAHIEVHREDPDRRANCLTAVYQANITEADAQRLHEGFVYVPPEKINDHSIVDHHRNTLFALIGDWKPLK